MHITSFIYDEFAIPAFLEVAHTLGFEWVQPVIRPDGRTVAVVFYSSDPGDLGDELYLLPKVREQLAGILEDDIEIVSAWDGHAAPAGALRAHDCQCVWPIKGRRSGGKPPEPLPFWAALT